MSEKKPATEYAEFAWAYRCALMNSGKSEREAFTEAVAQTVFDAIADQYKDMNKV